MDTWAGNIVSVTGRAEISLAGPPAPVLLWGLGQAHPVPPRPLFIMIGLLFIVPLGCEVLSGYLWNRLFNLPYLAGSPSRETLRGLHRACALNSMTELMKCFVDNFSKLHFVDGS